MLDSPAYLALVGAVLLTGFAAVALRVPAAWREWRRPTWVPARRETSFEIALDPSDIDVAADAVAAELRAVGYRCIGHPTRAGWRLAAIKRGWSRLAAILSHLALILLVVGAALGTAFASETRIGLFPGDQTLLAPPGPGLTSAVRFDRLNAEFDAAGNPVRFDTYVTFIRDGRAIRQQILKVNDPGAFDGYLIHAWTYGPAVELRVEDLSGRTLFDGPVALGGPTAGSRAPFVSLPSLDMELGLTLADPARNQLRVIAAQGTDVVDATVLRPGDEARLGESVVRLKRFTSYVTFVSRSDPGMVIVFAGGAVLVACLFVAFYLPRRRVMAVFSGATLRVGLLTERFDVAGPELDRLRVRIEARLRQQPIGQAG